MSPSIGSTTTGQTFDYTSLCCNAPGNGNANFCAGPRAGDRPRVKPHVEGMIINGLHQGAVDTPPNSALPLVAVIVGPDGEVITACVPGVADGEKLIADALAAARKPQAE